MFRQVDIMARNRHRRVIGLVQQKIKLIRTYPTLIVGIQISRNLLRFVIRLQPTPESIEYKVRIQLKLGYLPTAQLQEPKEIAMVNGQKPHHLYKGKNGDEYLCVFYPKGCEWSNCMFLADSFVPWVVTWLSAYEIWQVTGVWVYPEYVNDNHIKRMQL